MRRATAMIMALLAIGCSSPVGNTPPKLVVQYIEIGPPGACSPVCSPSTSVRFGLLQISNVGGETATGLHIQVLSACGLVPVFNVPDSIPAGETRQALTGRFGGCRQPRIMIDFSEEAHGLHSERPNDQNCSVGSGGSRRSEDQRRWVPGHLDARWSSCRWCQLRKDKGALRSLRT